MVSTGKIMQDNAFIESFNSRVPAECLYAQHLPRWAKSWRFGAGTATRNVSPGVCNQIGGLWPIAPWAGQPVAVRMARKLYPPVLQRRVRTDEAEFADQAWVQGGGRARSKREQGRD
jgi:hypothetical protein